MKETFNKTESKLKDALNNIEIKEIKITELERERKMAKMQMEEHLRNNNQDRINKIKHKLRLEFSLKLQRIKEEYSRFKVNVVEDVINVKKENGSMIAKIISKIEQHKQIVQEREAKYHEKNSKILQKLQKELESKPERSDEHENSNEVLQRKIRELEQDVVEIQDKLNQALDEKKIIESRYQACISREQDAIKLTGTISNDLSCKYKHKLAKILEIVDECNEKQKNKISEIETEVKKLTYNFDIELDYLKQENNQLLANSYKTQPAKNDIENWKQVKEKELESLAKSLQTVVNDLKSKEKEISKLKSERKLIIDSSKLIKKESAKKDQIISIKKSEIKELTGILQNLTESLNLNSGNIQLSSKINQEANKLLSKAQRSDFEDDC